MKCRASRRGGYGVCTAEVRCEPLLVGGDPLATATKVAAHERRPQVIGFVAVVSKKYIFHHAFDSPYRRMTPAPSTRPSAKSSYMVGARSIGYSSDANSSALTAWDTSRSRAMSSCCDL